MRYFVAGVMCCWAGIASAQEALRLEDVLAALQSKSPDIASAELAYRAATLQTKRLRALDDPQLSWMTEDISLQGEEEVSPMMRLQINQMIPWPGKRSAMEKVAQKEADVYQAKISTTSIELFASAKRAYYQLYLNQEQRRINREQSAIIETLVELVTAQLSAGMPMHHDALKMQTEGAMLDDDLLMLEADQQMWVAMLNSLMARAADIKIDKVAEAWSKPISLSEEELLQRAIQSQPALKEMLSMEQAELAMSDVARKELYPDLMVGAFYDAYLGEGDMFGLMMGLNLPVWAKSKQRIDIESAEVRASSVSKKRSAMELMLRAEIAQYVSMLRSIEKRMELIEKKTLPLAQQTFEASLATYPTGQTSAIEVLDALRIVTEQRSTMLKLRTQRELALVELELRVGAPLQEKK
jgi:cobalt-zinc-cadmium efflux system outer membrane protein